jgi:hypothetical protein
MSSRPSAVLSLFSTGLCAFVLAAVPVPARAAVHVALTPATQVVPPSTLLTPSDFDVFVDVTDASSLFNTFKLVVGYDPAVLTLLPETVPFPRQGCLMTGGCSAACGNLFHVFDAAGDSLSIDDALLCNTISVQGPGRLYRLRFRASSTAQATSLTIRKAQFIDAGLFVPGVVSAGCLVNIGAPVGVGPPPHAAARPVRVEPNPAFGRTNFVFEDNDGAPAEIEILDLQGRVVRALGPASVGTQSRLSWDGCDARGGHVPAGLYLVRIRRGEQVQHSRVILLQ